MAQSLRLRHSAIREQAMRNFKRYLLIPLVILLALIGYSLIPIEGQVILVLDDQVPGSWPQFKITPLSPQAGQDMVVQITDIEPWAMVRLTVNGQTVPLERWDELSGGATWRWEWRLSAPQTSTYRLKFYYDCHLGCQQRGQITIGPPTPRMAKRSTPTKLCVVFPNPERNWHDRSGWGVELTYAQLADDAGWGVDALAERIDQLKASDIRVLVRVDYAPGQSLPPTDDQIALAKYLAYLRRLARDDRLQDVYGYFLGSGYNSFGNNTLSADNPTTPAWYARLFNGYGEDVTRNDNAIQIIRAENPSVRVLVGSAQPWGRDVSAPPYQIDRPWLNYMNALVALLDEAAQAKQQAGIPLTVPNGFALHAPGNPNAPELAEQDRSLEPAIDLRRNGSQAGFRVYQDWLAIINAYPTTQGAPVYITASNTFIPSEGVPPAQNYPQGWLTTALATINQEPQVQSLCWFMDDIPGDTQWQWFNLTHHPGNLTYAAEEFDRALTNFP